VIAGKDDTVRSGAEGLARDLSAAGLNILLDDRTSSPGVKFADAELVGVPTILVVGRGLANGVVEVKDRASNERVEVPVTDVVAHLVTLVETGTTTQ
jgi:prolyl-tRNA synthetase